MPLVFVLSVEVVLTQDLPASPVRETRSAFGNTSDSGNTNSTATVTWPREAEVCPDQRQLRNESTVPTPLPHEGV